MMTVEDLRRERDESASVAYKSFMDHVEKNKDGLFCFFEGKDSPYYIVRVKQVFTDNYYPIICSGKSKVLKVYELLNYHREYDKYKKAFFIDSDFDPPISNAKIYETPCYSIENLYSSVDVIADILKSEFGLTEVHKDFISATTIYEKLQKEFHEAMTLLNAWYACLIDLKNKTNQKTGVSFEDKIPKGFVKISLGEIIQNYDLPKLKIEFPDALEIDSTSLEAKISKFEKCDKGKVFRGKFELEFAIKILELLIEDSKTAKKILTKKISYNITSTQVISQFSQYAETPEDLLTYIRNVVK